MSTTLPPIPYNVPMLNQFGLISSPWADWFRKLHLRAGGSIAETNLELFSIDTARIDDAAVTADKIAAAVAGSGLSGGAGSALSVNVDNSTIEISGDTLRNKDSGITFAKLLSTDWSNSKAASGYFKIGSGLYVQWGVTGSLATATTTSISFPTTFPTACRQVVAGIQGNSAGSTVASGQWGTGNYSTTAFDLYNRTSATYTFNYIAVGN
jgi:hypothetical protein